MNLWNKITSYFKKTEKPDNSLLTRVRNDQENKEIFITECGSPLSGDYSPWDGDPAIYAYYCDIFTLLGVKTEQEQKVYRKFQDYKKYCEMTAHLVGWDLTNLGRDPNESFASATWLDKQVLNHIWDTLQTETLGPLWNIADEHARKIHSLKITSLNHSPNSAERLNYTRDAIYDILFSEFYDELENAFAPRCRRTK